MYFNSFKKGFLCFLFILTSSKHELQISIKTVTYKTKEF